MAAVTSGAETIWQGDLASGSGIVKPRSGAFPELPVSWAKRTERSNGATSPEELIAAAHSACFSMAFSSQLAKAGHAPEQLDTSAEVDFVVGEGITAIRLTVTGRVPGLADATFQELAGAAKDGCPVSKALAGVAISVQATLEA